MTQLQSSHLVGISQAFQEVQRQIDLVRSSTAPVLLTGELGCGKGAVAREIHNSGIRAGGPFIRVECGSAPHNVLSNFLLGGEEAGAFERANGGSLYLADADRLPLDLQEQISRFFQDGTIASPDGKRLASPEVRVMIGTTRDLRTVVDEGEFRQDLFFRFNVFKVRVPPLRERTADVLPLAQHFLARFKQEHEVQPKTMAPEALEGLRRYSWPGNCRELENVLLGAVLAAGDGGTIGVECLPDVISCMAPERPVAPAAQAAPAMESPEDPIVPLHELERRAILHALQVTRGNVTRAARALGIGRATLYRKLERFKAQA